MLWKMPCKNSHEHNITVLFVNLLEQPRYLMERIDIIPDLVPEEQIFDTFNQCITWIKEKHN